MTQQGSCLCGDIKYQLNGDILNVVNCHCNLCRSHSGAAFSTYVVAPHAALLITTGEDNTGSFAIDRGHKHFCRRCGTPLFNIYDGYPGLCMIYHGTLENHDRIRPKMNIWYENRLDWTGTIASIHSLEQGPENKRPGKRP